MSEKESEGNKEDQKQRRILVTGAAGFIGFHLCIALRTSGDIVLGFDNFNNKLYDESLKYDRARYLKDHHDIDITTGELSDREDFFNCAAHFKPTHIVNLAAQAGVRYSLDNPDAYIESNIIGFLNVLEYCRKDSDKISLVYASSSSVYGLNEEQPFKIEDKTDQQASLYGVTKKTNELMARTYWHLFKVRSIGLRFFTVYGPWGRPDMAVFKFTKKIFEGEEIDVYNNGEMERDFTFISDIVDGLLAALSKVDGCRLYNLGNSVPEKLDTLIELLETEIGIKARKRFLSMQKGDVLTTCADLSNSFTDLVFRPKMSLKEGIKRFIQWYRDYFKV